VHIHLAFLPACQYFSKGTYFDDKATMKKIQSSEFGSTAETLLYPFLLLALMWVLFWGERVAPFEMYKWGILPQHLSGLKGIFFSPLLHAPHDIMHIVNNSMPIAILLGALVYFYKSIAGKVFFLSWFFSGFLVWCFARDNGAYHIGMSGVIYALAGFLFFSGTMRKYRPLQGIALFVVFMYGSMIWGMFPTEERISWEGHLTGMLTGTVLAVVFRKAGPQAPKYQYEIEQELGIEPPDLEGQWRENIRLAREREEEMQRQLYGFVIRYDYKPKEVNDPPKPPDETQMPPGPGL